MSIHSNPAVATIFSSLLVLRTAEEMCMYHSNPHTQNLDYRKKTEGGFESPPDSFYLVLRASTVRLSASSAVVIYEKHGSRSQQCICSESIYFPKQRFLCQSCGPQLKAWYSAEQHSLDYTTPPMESSLPQAFIRLNLPQYKRFTKFLNRYQNELRRVRILQPVRRPARVEGGYDLEGLRARGTAP